MSERTTLEIIAPTVEEALEQGLSQLGLTADAVSVEVLDSGSKGLFGLGGRQVRVRLTVNPPPGTEVPPPPAPKPVSSSEKAPAKKAESTPKAREQKQREQKPKEQKPRVEKQPQEKPAPVATRRIDELNDPLLNTSEEVVSKLIHHLGMQGRAAVERIDAARHAVLVDIFDEIQPQPFDGLVAELDHLLELPRRVDVHQGEWRLGGIKGLHRQVQHHGGILAHRIEHHRVGELGRHLAHDVDALGFQAPQMRYNSFIGGQFSVSRKRTVK